jgi:signal transduction histidine kinase
MSLGLQRVRRRVLMTGGRTGSAAPLIIVAVLMAANTYGRLVDIWAVSAPHIGVAAAAALVVTFGGGLVLGSQPVSRRLVQLRHSALRLAAHERRLAVAVAKRIADEVEPALVLARLRAEAATAERNRIASELHDTITQSLYSACMITEALPRMLDRDAAAGRRTVTELEELLHATLADLRVLTLGLRPAGIESASLARLIHERADTFTGRSRVPVDVIVTGEPPVSGDMRFALYRVLGELLANVARHAGARRVAIHLSTTLDGGGRIDVIDDGHGLDPDAIAADHHGLGVARDRLAPIGGELFITSDRGGGVHAVVTWPGERKRARHAPPAQPMVEASGAA